MITTFYALKSPFLTELNTNYSYLNETITLVCWSIVIGFIHYYNNKLSFSLSIMMIAYVAYYGVINNLYWITIYMG